MEPEEPAAPSAADEADPFAPLKTITAFDCITLKVPVIWPCAWDEKARMWCCCEDIEDPTADTGTLWIDYDMIELGQIGPQADRALEAMAQGISLEKAMTGEANFGMPALDDAPSGKIISYWRRTETNGQRYLSRRWHCLSLAGTRLLVTHFSLVLTAETAGRPAWQRLAETMDREIRAAEIGLPDPTTAAG
jgi:hypothetical protein